MFLTYEMTVKSKYTIVEFVVFSIGITLYIKIETKNDDSIKEAPAYCQSSLDGLQKCYTKVV